MATLAGPAEIPVTVVLGDGRSHELKISRQTTWQEFRKRVRKVKEGYCKELAMAGEQRPVLRTVTVV